MAIPRITTVIPTYKRPILLRRAIESALAQSFGDFEVCVYDNASDDETEGVVLDFAKVDARVRYKKNTENIGALRNIHQGIASVETDIYSLLSDDDFLLPGVYSAVASAVDRNPEVGFVCTKVVIVNELTSRVKLQNANWLPGVYQPGPVSVSKMYRSHFTSTGVFFRRRLRHTIGNFDPICNDLMYTTMAAAASPFAVLDRYGAAFIMRSESFSNTTSLSGIEPQGLYAAFTEVASKVMALDCSSEDKAHLLLLVVDQYGFLFETKAYSAFMLGRADPADAVARLLAPLAPTARSAVVRLFRRLPERVRPLLVKLVQASVSLRRLKFNLTTRDWLPLSTSLQRFMQSASIDTNIFMQALSEAPYFVDGRR